MFYENWNIIPLIIGDLWGLGVLEGVSGGGEEMKSEILYFFPQKEHPAPKILKFIYKKQKIVIPIVILEYEYPSPQLHHNLKPMKDSFCTTVAI